MVKTLAMLALLLGACDFGFETPSIVIDLRVLGVTATPPEIVIDVDPMHPEDAVPQLQANPFTVDVLVADPGESRSLDWDMTLCPETRDHRCDPEDEQQPVASGTITSGEVPHATFVPSLAVVEASVRADSLLGFGGIPVMVQLRVWPADQPEAKVYASKRILVSPRLPAQRVANQNPVIEAVQDVIGSATLAPGSCDSGAVALTLGPRESRVLLPIEAEDAREAYVLPTFNGGSRSFVENISYSWYATAGEWSNETTGGAEGPSGPPKLETTFTAPGQSGPVPLWMVARDERGGSMWIEYCVLVQ